MTWVRHGILVVHNVLTLCLYHFYLIQKFKDVPETHGLWGRFGKDKVQIQRASSKRQSSMQENRQTAMYKDLFDLRVELEWYYFAQDRLSWRQMIATAST